MAYTRLDSSRSGLARACRLRWDGTWGICPASGSWVPLTPGFPVKGRWVNSLHAAFLNESRTRGTDWRCVQEIRVSRSFFARCGGRPLVAPFKPGGIPVGVQWNPTSREKRARYPDFLYATPSNAACAAFIKESRMKFANATNLDRKSGVRGPNTTGRSTHNR